MKDFPYVNRKSLSQHQLASPNIEFALTSVVLVILFMILDHWLFMVATLPQSNYYKPVLIIELAQHLFDAPDRFLFSSIILGLILFRLRFFLVRWDELETGRGIRLFVFSLAAILCWSLSSYDYNLFFNQVHYYDRFSLVLLTLLVLWRPFFILPFLLLVITLTGQFSYPLEKSYSLAQPSMPLRILTMFVSMLFLYAMIGKKNISNWLFLMLCIIAAHYWVPGIGKVLLNWVTYGHIYNLLPATYANGWLAFLSPAQIASMTQSLASVDWFIRIFTLGVQLLSVFLLWRRSTLFALLTAWTLLHIGIFITSGILFWQWILVEIFTLVLLHSLGSKTTSGNDQAAIETQASLSFIKNRYSFALSVCLIATSILWLRPVRLAWYDTPVSYTYRFEAEGVSHQAYTLPPGFFTPYSYAFTLGRFGYSVPDIRLSITWGATSNRQIAEQLLLATSKEAIFAIEQKWGHNKFDQQKSEVFDNFIQQFITHANQRGTKLTLFDAVQAPPQLWTFPRGYTYTFQEPIRTVNVYQVMSWFDGRHYQEIDNQLIRQINITELP